MFSPLFLVLSMQNVYLNLALVAAKNSVAYSDSLATARMLAGNVTDGSLPSIKEQANG